jgi:hypothetical protein
MPFHCPNCGGGSLEITFSLELPPNEVDDEAALQSVGCESCNFRGIAVYGENRRGSLKSESWSHIGYQVSEETLEPFLKTLVQCPSPRDRRCQCPTHLALGKRLWVNPAQHGLDVQKEFAMRLVR